MSLNTFCLIGRWCNDDVRNEPSVNGSLGLNPFTIRHIRGRTIFSVLYCIQVLLEKSWLKQHLAEHIDLGSIQLSSFASPGINRYEKTESLLLLTCSEAVHSDKDTISFSAWDNKKL